MKTPRLIQRFRRDKRAVSPAVSTVIVTSAVIVMVMVAMVYANNFLNARMAENEFGTNKQFMLTTALQLDDIAWTIGRTQTVRYSSQYGSVTFQNNAISYTIEVTTQGGGEPLTFTYDTGIILFNMPSSVYTLGNDYFERVFPNDDNVTQNGATAAVSHVYVIEKLPMSAGNYTRVAIAPTIRTLTSNINGQTYVRFYMADLDSGTSPHNSQSVTLIGRDIAQYMRSNVTQIRITVEYPSSEVGFDADFFRFSESTIVFNAQSAPPLPANSVVEFYLGEVGVSLGLYS